MIVLTKADLHPATRTLAVADVETIADGVPVLAISSVTGAGLDEMTATCRPGVTAVLLGSSGVGKSTIVNTLLGEELLATQELRNDGRGRHTTTRRELIQLPGGGLIIDTPGYPRGAALGRRRGHRRGLRRHHELLRTAASPTARTTREPGCAVRAALADGTLAAERWESYLKLQGELAHLERKLDKRAASEERKKWKRITQEARERMRMKGKG